MTSVKQHLISLYYCNDLMFITGHGPLSHLWERFTKANNVAWDHEKTSLEMLDLIIEGKCSYNWLKLVGKILYFILQKTTSTSPSMA